MRTLTRVAASAAALALVTGAIELLKGHVPVLSLAVLYLLAIIPVAVAWGTVYAVGDGDREHARASTSSSCRRSTR